MKDEVQEALAALEQIDLEAQETEPQLSMREVPDDDFTHPWTLAGNSVGLVELARRILHAVRYPGDHTPLDDLFDESDAFLDELMVVEEDVHEEPPSVSRAQELLANLGCVVGLLLALSIFGMGIWTAFDLMRKLVAG